MVGNWELTFFVKFEVPVTPESSWIHRDRAQEITVEWTSLIMAGRGLDGSEKEVMLEERKKIDPGENQHKGLLSLCSHSTYQCANPIANGQYVLADYKSSTHELLMLPSKENFIEQPEELPKIQESHNCLVWQ